MVSLAVAALTGVLTQCGAPAVSTSTVPEATSFETPPEFAGQWIGEIGTLPGVFVVGELGAGKYYGSFRADVGLREYVLLMEQTSLETVGGGSVASNRTLFTWQDGQGARGRGWLLINPEETALSGSFGMADSYEGEGEWSFIRVSD
jgi:hypothetical protein